MKHHINASTIASTDQFVVFTDGSSRGNPGPGGWASVVIGGVSNDSARPDAPVIELGGREAVTTNNRMELMAAAEALARIPEGASVTVHTDSSYLINGITKWVSGWKRNGWVTKTKEGVVNKDVWMRLDASCAARRVKWTHVGGHVGVVGNERCDHIATAFADERAVALFDGLFGNYDLPNIFDVSHDTGSAARKKSSSSHSNAKAYSYVSSVAGVIETHRTWPECEKRVKGAKGARYKKSISGDDERNIIQQFETFI